jgi:hypothetical protein
MALDVGSGHEIVANGVYEILESKREPLSKSVVRGLSIDGSWSEEMWAIGGKG